MLPIRIGIFVDKYCTDIIRIRLYKLSPSFPDTFLWVKATGPCFTFICFSKHRFICSHCHLVAVYNYPVAS